jgi:hypothetical protein
LRIRRWIGKLTWLAVLTLPMGCAHGPRNFNRVQDPAPVVRARAIGLARRQPDSYVLGQLVERLTDSDPVVRMAAHEELRKRTGRDFGYVPWASPEERAGAIRLWRDWVTTGSGGLKRSSSPPISPSKTLPAGAGESPIR